jgi:hypothetical protein
MEEQFVPVVSQKNGSTTGYKLRSLRDQNLTSPSQPEAFIHSFSGIKT